MTDMNQILATALGNLAARAGGITKVVLPDALGIGFRKAVADAVANAGQEAFGIVVGDQPDAGEIAADMAIKFRSPEKEGISTVVIVTTQIQAGQFKKSLELARDLLADGLPGGLENGPSASIDIAALAHEVAVQASDSGGDIRKVEELAKEIVSAAGYLANAYREYGNDRQSWPAAFMSHLDMISRNLPAALAMIDSGLPGREAIAVHLAAGLPRPNTGTTYAPANDPKSYANIISERWSSSGEVDRALTEIEEVDGKGTPITKIDWQTLAISRVNAGHPILAVCSHGYSPHSPDGWLKAWATTTEAGFFFPRDIPDIQASIEVELEDGSWQPVPTLVESSDIFVVPQPAAKIDQLGEVDLGTFNFVLELPNHIDDNLTQSLQFEIRPKSDATIDVEKVTVTGRGVEALARLNKKIGNNGGKWKEKPLSLFVWSDLNLANNPFRDPTKISLIVPNPTRPVVIGIEAGKGSGKHTINFQVPTRVLCDGQEGKLAHDLESETPSIAFSGGNGNCRIAVVGPTADPVWPSGTELINDEVKDWISYFKVGLHPDDATVAIGDYEVELTWPVIESGQAAPITAAILGESLVPISEDLRATLKRDPRFELECWLRDQCISHRPSDNFKSCLGSVLLAINTGKEDGDFVWQEAHGVFSNVPANAPVSFPPGASEKPEVEAFWDAFEGLRLQDLVGGSSETALPSAIDLRGLDQKRVEAYLEAYNKLIGSIDENQAKGVWLGYPLSAVLFRPGNGAFEGVLLSPLHPLRLAWHWSVQVEAARLQDLKHFSSVAHSFLRFIDGDGFPLIGPSLAPAKKLLSLGLDAGAEDFFAAWHLLAAVEFHKSGSERKAQILGLELPLGSPSGLDEGGISAAIRDYLRVYPMGPQLRIGLASQGQRDRFAETDQAVISATQQLLDKAREELPGGVRVIDSHDRTGVPPDASRVLGSLNASKDSRGNDGRPPLEWLIDHGDQKVDLQFLEDTVVSLDLMQGAPAGTAQSLGTAGSRFPINRFKAWRALPGAGHSAALVTGASSSSFTSMAGYHAALSALEGLTFGGKGAVIHSDLQIGQALFSDKARWTITGNSYLDPASLSRKLRDEQVGLALWEWRPAFLTRNFQKGVRASVASTQPYTILAKQSPALEQEVAGHLAKAGVSGEATAKQLVHSLGARAIGLSSLLTMGSTHSMGALGFAFAFRALEGWERACTDGEIRCVLPMDAVFPLLDTLGVGAKSIDDQRRADLLLIKAWVPAQDSQGNWPDDVVARIFLQPVEIKARAGSGTFPGRNSNAIQDPLEQLSSSYKVLEKACENLIAHGQSSQLLSSAFATLIEAAFALKPHELRAAPEIETKLLELVAAGRLEISATPGTLLWFQGSATSENGAPYEPRNGAGNRPGQVLANFSTLASCKGDDEFCTLVAGVVESSIPLTITTATSASVTSENAGTQGTAAEVAAEIQTHDKSDSENPESDDAHVPDSDNGSEGDGKEKDAGNVLEPESQENQTKPEIDNPPPSQPPTSPPPGIEILVGAEMKGATSAHVFFKPSNTKLTQMNIGVVGDLGTGKTQFLKSLVYQLSQSSASNRGTAPKTFIFDYKKDYSTGDFPEAISAQVLDPTRTLPINFFALPAGSSSKRKVYRASFFRDLLQRIANTGSVQGNNLYSSVMDAYAACAPGYWPLMENILDIYRQKNGGTADTVVAKLTMMIDLQIFEKSPENIHSFGELFTKNTVLNLSDLGGAGQEIVDIIATMFLEHLYTDYMKSLEKQPFITGEDGISRRFIDSMVLIDEAHHAMSRGFDVLMNMMLEGREFGLGVILSSQFLSHFKLGGKNWAEALSTWVVHNVKGATAKDLENIGFAGGAQQMAQALSSLQPHWAYYRCANGQTEGILMKGQPFFSLPRDDAK